VLGDKLFMNSYKSGLGAFLGKMLIATPSLDESIFQRSLIFICSHDEEGAIGVIFNKPSGIIKSKDIFDAFNVKRRFKINRKYIIYNGGPVEDDKLFILSGILEQSADNIILPILYTNAEAFLLDVAKGENDDKFIICKGFCGWGPGQLEQEVNQNSWIVSDVSLDALYNGKPDLKWEKFIKKIGIKNLDRLVSYSGNA
jgi:putative transcriptional regulator